MKPSSCGWRHPTAAAGIGDQTNNGITLGATECPCSGLSMVHQLLSAESRRLKGINNIHLRKRP